MSTGLDFYCAEILNGKTPITVEYESEQVLAYHHTKPSFPTHIVIIPKKHINSLVTIQHDDFLVLMEILEVAKELVIKLKLEKDGAKIITNMGKFQDTPHLHFHLLSGEKYTSFS